MMSSESNGLSRVFAVALVVLVVFVSSPAAAELVNRKEYGNGNCWVADDIDEFTDERQLVFNCGLSNRAESIMVFSPYSKVKGWGILFYPSAVPSGASYGKKTKVLWRVDKGTTTTVVARWAPTFAVLDASWEDANTFLHRIAQGQRLVFRIGYDFTVTTAIPLDGAAAAVADFRERVSRLK